MQMEFTILLLLSLVVMVTGYYHFSMEQEEVNLQKQVNFIKSLVNQDRDAVHKNPLPEMTDEEFKSNMKITYHSSDTGQEGLQMSTEPSYTPVPSTQVYKFVIYDLTKQNRHQQYQTAIKVTRNPDQPNLPIATVDCRFLPSLNDLSVLLFYSAKLYTTQPNQNFQDQPISDYLVYLVKSNSVESGKVRILPQSNKKSDLSTVPTPTSTGSPILTSLSVTGPKVEELGLLAMFPILRTTEVKAVFQGDKGLVNKYYVAAPRPGSGPNGEMVNVFRLVMSDKPISLEVYANIPDGEYIEVNPLW